MKRMIVALAAAIALSTMPPAAAQHLPHCAYMLHDDSSRPTLIGCYATQYAAQHSVRSGTAHIGTEYTDIGYQSGMDGTVDYYANQTCSPGHSYGDDYVGDQFNDKFLSGKAYGGCDHNKKFENTNQNGIYTVCLPNCQDYGTLDGAVSSLKWNP